MPIRGESVGSAYVRIYADGSEVPEDIRRSIEEAEPSVREAGRDHGRTYGEEFDKEVRKSFKGNFGDTKKGMFEDLNDSLTDSLARLELSDRFFNGREWKKFERRLGDEFGDAGRLAAQRLEAQFRDSTNLEGLADQMSRIGPLVRRAQADILNSLHSDALAENKAFDARVRQQINDYNALHSEALDANRAFDARLRAQLEDQDKDYELHLDHMREVVEANLQFIRDREDAFAEHEHRLTNERDADFEHWTAGMSRLAGSLETEFDRITKGVDEIGRKGHSTFGDRSSLLRDFRVMRDAVKGTAFETEEWKNRIEETSNRLRDLTPNISRFNHYIDLASDRTGRLFGKGSRNNFFNFFGSVVGGLVSIGKIIPNTIGWFTRLSRSVSEAEGFTGKLAAGFGQIGSLLGTAAAGFAGLVVIIGAILVVLGPVMALLSGLVGILVALAGTVVFAAIGALGALAGSFGVLALAIGAVVGGIKLMSDAQKKVVKEGLAPLVDEAKRLAKVFDNHMFAHAAVDAHRLSGILDGLRPLAAKLGDAIASIGDSWTKALAGPGFRSFKRHITEFLPHAVKTLGDIIGNVLGGMSGLFIGLEPITRRFLRWVDQITADFSAWANTANGRKEIRQFFKQAGDSAEALGGFLESAANWLFKILDAGNGTGDTIFSNMADDFDRWSKWLDDHPDAISDWFGNAEDLAGNIGDLIDNINKLFDDLDDPKNRKAANDFVEFLAKGAEFAAAFSEAMGSVDSALGSIGNIFGSDFLGQIGHDIWYVLGGKWADQLVAGVVAGLKGAWGAVGDALKSVGSIGSGGIGANLINVGAITGAVDKVPGIVASAFGKISLGGIRDRLTAPFSGIAGTIGGLLSGVPGAVSSRFEAAVNSVRSVPGRISGFFNGIAGKIAANFLTVTSLIGGKFDAAAAYISTIPGRIVGFFSGLAGRIIAAIGPIDIYPHIHMPNLNGGGSKSGGFGSDGVTASGGLFNGAQRRIIGEAGPEAVVPLDRPLSQVDPAVRALSAIAQGLQIPAMANGGIVAPQRSVDASGWTIMSNSEDPAIVAAEVINRLVAQVV